jgi:hypothetical protein
MLFYANVIAYHPAAIDCCPIPEPEAFFTKYAMETASQHAGRTAA